MLSLFMASMESTVVATLMPLMLGWVLASVVGSRLLLRIGYRAVTLTGMILLTPGTFQMSRISAHSSQLSLPAGLAPRPRRCSSAAAWAGRSA